MVRYTLTSGVHLSKKFYFIYFNESPLKMMKNNYLFLALFVLKVFNLKQLGWEGGGGSIWAPPCGSSKNVSSRERVNPWFFVTFYSIISHIFPENFIESPQVVQKIWRFYLSILTIFINFSGILTFPWHIFPNSSK